MGTIPTSTTDERPVDDAGTTTAVGDGYEGVLDGFSAFKEAASCIELLQQEAVDNKAKVDLEREQATTRVIELEKKLNDMKKQHISEQNFFKDSLESISETAKN